MAKKLFYSMGEVSEMFDVNASLIRFWETKFDILRPQKNKKGNRLFSPADVENLKLIYHLVKERGMTLDGAARCLKQNKGTISRDAELLERLQRVRALLEEVRAELKESAEDRVVVAENGAGEAGTFCFRLRFGGGGDVADRYGDRPDRVCERTRYFGISFGARSAASPFEVRISGWGSIMDGSTGREQATVGYGTLKI